MPYYVLSFFAVTIFALVHLYAYKMVQLNFLTTGKFLSMGGGVSIAYVFVDLLPKLCLNDAIVTEAFHGVFPYFERHVFIMVLAGFLMFFIVDRKQSLHQDEGTSIWLSLPSYALFNFLIGYAVADKNDPEVQPLALFTFALSLHYFINDFSLSEEHGEEYQMFGKWVLIGALFLGWACGFLFDLPPSAVALLSAFIGGGVIMNVIRHELPADNPHSMTSFLLSAAFYTLVLLFIGA